MTPLVHLVREARAPRPHSLVVLLHGVGSHEGDLFSLAEHFPTDATVVSVRAPLTQRPGAYAWFPVQFTPSGPIADAVEAEESRRLLVAFVKQARETFGVDPHRVALVGFSQGAIMAASVALTEPELVRAAVLMSGRILPEAAEQAAPSARLEQTSFLVVHGTHDDRLPIHHGRASVATLRSLGASVEVREFPMGHTISDDSLTFASEWLEEQIRPS